MEVVDLCSGDGWFTLQIAKIPRHVRADRSWFIRLKSRPMTTALSLSDRQRESTMSSILDNKNTSAPSVFLPAALLREARRQKGLATADVPPVCILDPDGYCSIVQQTADSRNLSKHGPCYHTELDTFLLGAIEVGIVGRVVGASFAVLVAEELFASGCRLLVSLTSADQVAPAGPPPYFVVIYRALRDEGTSYHYLPTSEFADADPELVAAAGGRSRRSEVADDNGAELDYRRPFSRNGRSDRGSAHQGDFLRSKWRRRHSTLSRARRRGGCFVWRTSTNTMGMAGEDFEKGEADGTRDALYNPRGGRGRAA